MCRSQINITKFFICAVQLITNVDFDKQFQSRYSIEFNVRGTLSLSDDSGFGKNVIMFGVDNSSSQHDDIKKKIYQFLVNVQQINDMILQ